MHQHQKLLIYKNQLFAKAGQKVEMGRPEVAASMFADDEEIEGAELEIEPDQETQEEE